MLLPSSTTISAKTMHSSAKSLLGIFLFSALLLANPSLALSNGATVYDLLPQYGLPSGLLPDGVKDYSLSENGNFVVELEKPCYVHFEYLVYYEKKITGTLNYGSIKNLKGIQVKKLFIWLDVDEIKVDLPPSDSIYFVVGWITKKLQVKQFQTVHSCSKNLYQMEISMRKIPLLVTDWREGGREGERDSERAREGGNFSSSN